VGDAAFRPATGPNSASVVLAELARLRDQAVHRLAGTGRRVTQKRLAEDSGVPLATVNSWATGTSLPRDLDQLAAVGAVLAGWAGEAPPATRAWSRLLQIDQAARSVPGERGGEGTQVGRLIAELSDPFVLEVHRPVVIDSAGADLPVLPPYIRRGHDAELARVVARAAGGRSGMAVLVGGSSTGKTRACWEAVHLLPPGWRLWHPFDPTRPEAVLAELPRLGPRTVVWLNETQGYLDTPGDVGERVAAALRTLLIDSGREPVLVLGTLWPGHWDTLTREGAVHSQARIVLAGTDIPVPAAFTGSALQDLERAASADVRLAWAAADAEDGQVIQYLAGVPELLARYRHAPPAARALIHAAMDARRLGHRVALPQALLEAAAPAYLTDTEWDPLGEDWLERALAYTAAPCKGVLGPLTRSRPRPDRSRTGRGSPDGTGQRTGGHADTEAGPLYRLADYLDQYGRRHRNEQFPPAGFWAAAADHADPGDQAALGAAAHDRGLYRAAAQLRKRAGTRGDPRAAACLIDTLHYLHPADDRPAHWAAAHVTLDDPRAVADLLASLWEAGAGQQVAALFGRGLAAHVTLDDPYAVADLLGSLREAGAGQQAAALAARAAAHVTLNDPRAVAILLGSLRDVGMDQQVTALAARAADHVTLDDPYTVAILLGSLRDVGMDQQVTALAARASDHVTLDNPYAVAVLLDSLREAGAGQQVTVLLSRDPADHVILDNPYAVASLLDSLREAGADQQVIALAARAADHVPLDNPPAVADLLGSLREAGADQQVTALAVRAADHVTHDDPRAVGSLPGKLREAGANQQVTMLLGGDPADRVTLDNPYAVASLLGKLREAGADQQVAALLSRDPADHVTLDDPRAVADLLDSLREAGADQQVTALAARAAAHVPLDNPPAVADLLGSLREAGADQQVTALAVRAAAHVTLDDPRAVASLLGSLREAGADQQVTVLAARLPAAGMFGFVPEYTGSRFRFGREPDGRSAESWGWDNLD
jgi:uncharacterized protein YidB (DUF937 family)